MFSHIGDLDGLLMPNGNRWKVQITISVHDLGHNPLVGATVTGTWSRGNNGIATCTTNALGQCTVTTGSIKPDPRGVTFTVTNVVRAGYAYQSSANHDPENDSNGTTITVKWFLVFLAILS